MTLGTWMREHEVLAAAIFVAVALALMGVFALVERRLKTRVSVRLPSARDLAVCVPKKKARRSGGPVVQEK